MILIFKDSCIALLMDTYNVGGAPPPPPTPTQEEERLIEEETETQ